MTILLSIVDESKRAPSGKLAGDSVFWDGGPSVLLQESAAALWQGAADFDNSLMNGGEIETDYDVACGTEEWCRHRYGRDMLILNEFTNGNTIVVLPSGMIAITAGEAEKKVITQAAQTILAASQDYESFPFHIEDSTVRLLAAADSGEGSLYGYVELPVRPGTWSCCIADGESELILLLCPPASGDN